MINYENAKSYLETFKEALKDNSFTESEKDSMKKIIKDNRIGTEFGSGRIFSTKNYAFVVHEAAIGYNLGVVE